MRPFAKDNNSEEFYAVFVDDALYGPYYVGNHKGVKTVYEALRFQTPEAARSFVESEIMPNVRERVLIKKVLVSFDIEAEEEYFNYDD